MSSLPGWRESDFEGWTSEAGARLHDNCGAANCVHCAYWENRLEWRQKFLADPEDSEWGSWVKLGIDSVSKMPGLGCRICEIAKFPVGCRKWARCGIITGQRLGTRLSQHERGDVHQEAVQWFFTQLGIEDQIFNLLEEAEAEDFHYIARARARRERQHLWECVLARLKYMRARRRLFARSQRRRLESLRRLACRPKARAHARATGDDSVASNVPARQSSDKQAWKCVVS